MAQKVKELKIDLTKTTPYRKRPIRFLKINKPVPGMRLKLYGISAHNDVPPPKLILAGRGLIVEKLPELVNVPHYGLGFGIVHEGAGCDFVCFGFWADQNELRCHTFVRRDRRVSPPLWEHVTAEGLVACTYDLAVFWHERSAWVRHMLENPKGPDREAYLEDVLNTDV